MARARNIKPGFYKNEDLAECSVWARLLFPGLWMLADREGRLEDRPKRIKGEIFPYDSIEVDPLLKELQEWGFIERYIHDGKKIINVVNFLEHQYPHGKESDSEFPDENGFYTVHERNQKNGCVTGKYTKHSTSNVPAQYKNETCTVLAHPESGLLNPESGLLNTEANASSCAEPCVSTPEASSDEGKTVIEFPTNSKTVNYPIKQSQLDEWQELYPGVDVVQQLRAMKGWLISNPVKAKTKNGMPRFINSWLAKEQNNRPQKSRVDRADQERGLIEKQRGNYDTKSTTNASAGTGQKLSIAEHASAGFDRIKARLEREEQAARFADSLTVF